MSTFLKPFPNNFGERRISPPSHRITIISRSLENITGALLSERQTAKRKSSHIVTELGITKYTPLLEQKATEWNTPVEVTPEKVVFPLQKVEKTILQEPLEIDQHLMDRMAEELRVDEPEKPTNVINLNEIRQKIADSAASIGDAHEHLAKAA